MRERLEEIRRQVNWARTYGLPLEEISPAEVAVLFPLVDLDGVVGGCFLPSDGQIDPSQLTYALAAGARAGGVRIATRTRVLAVDTADGRHGRRVTGVRTDRGDVECEVVVDCGGMYAAEIGRLGPGADRAHVAPVRRHRRDARRRRGGPGSAAAEPARPRPARLLPPGGRRPRRRRVRTQPRGVHGDLRRVRRHPGGLQRAAAAGGLVEAGGDLRERAAPGAEAGGDRDPARRQRARGLHAGQRVLPGRDVRGRVLRRRGVLRARDRRRRRHRPGRRRLDRRRGAGARRVAHGHPAIRACLPLAVVHRVAHRRDVCDVLRHRLPERQRRAGRPLRSSPVYAWHAAYGAVFGEKAGWERVEHYHHAGGPGLEELRPRGWAGRDWSPSVAVEHLATRGSAGLFDESSFAKIDVGGPDAAAFLERVCDNRVARAVGDVTYTQCLNERGGIEMDVTVTRLGEQAFRIVTGTAFGTHDLGWLQRQARRADVDVRLADVSGSEVCFALWGPRARDVLAPRTPADLDAGAFPFMTAREITVGDVPVRALRVTFVGEHGWELYAPAEYGLRLWESLAGDPDVTVAGYRAIESLRLEKAYRVWSSDITPETNPFEAGLGFCVKLGKPGGFVGEDALATVKAQGVARRLACLVLDDRRNVVLGGEPVLAGDAVLGRVTSGGFGYSVRASIAYAYLPVEFTPPGTGVEVDLFGVRQPASVVKAPLVG